MIINIEQTASNIAQKYAIWIGDEYLEGSAGSASRFQAERTVSRRDGELCCKYRSPRPTDLVPLIRLFGREQIRERCDIVRNGELCGSVCCVKGPGPFRLRYRLDVADTVGLDCYPLARGAYNYVPIYDGARQIALMETLMVSEDMKFKHKVYLLDSHADCAGYLAIFAIYYANYRFTDRFHMSLGTTVYRKWTISAFADRHDPDWRSEHFPSMWD